MPTDIVAATARKREARRKLKATLSVLGTCVIIGLINVMLLFISPGLARAFDLWASPGAVAFVGVRQNSDCSGGADRLRICQPAAPQN